MDIKTWLQTSHNGLNLGDNHNQGMKILSPYKMDKLKPISDKKFNEFIKGRGFRGRNNYALKDLKSKFGFKPWLKEKC